VRTALIPIAVLGLALEVYATTKDGEDLLPYFNAFTVN